MISTLLRPGLWLMQRCQFGSKLALLALALLWPMVFLLVQIVWDGGNRVDATLSVWVGIVGTVLGLYLAAAFYLTYRESMDQVHQALDLMVAGDMRQKLSTRGHDELASMAGKVNKLGATISAMVANVRSNSAFVAHAGKSMAAGNRDLSDRTEQQAANLEQTAASVEELSSTVQDNSRTAQQANAQAARVRDVADEGASTMAQAIESVEAIQSSAKRMDEIVSVIDGLAFQTNILALNAAVEAARAGESGRGFAVVASEVRSLAQRSAASAKEIRHLIGSSSSQVDGSVQKIRAAGTNINQIVSGIREVAASMAQISTSSAEQSASLVRNHHCGASARRDYAAQRPDGGAFGVARGRSGGPRLDPDGVGGAVSLATGLRRGGGGAGAPGCGVPASMQFARQFYPRRHRQVTWIL